MADVGTKLFNLIQTNLILQSIILSHANRIISFDNGYKLEDLHLQSGILLRASQIFIGNKQEEIKLFEQTKSKRTLLKVCGSIERPYTILSKNENPINVINEFSTNNIMLYVGFSIESEYLKPYTKDRNRRAYIFIQADEFENFIAKFGGTMLFPIVYQDSQREIAEYVTEIFGRNRNTPNNFFLHFENRYYEIQNIANRAFDTQRHRSLLTGIDNKIVNKNRLNQDFIKYIIENEGGDIQDIIRQLLLFPDVFYELSDFLLKHDAPNKGENVFKFFKQTQNLELGEQISTQIDKVLLSNVHNPLLDYYVLRKVATLLRIRKKHPAMFLPMETVTIGNFKVPIYPITNYQVRELIEINMEENDYIRPYTIRNIDDIDKIMEILKNSTDENWRLPTVEEWLFIAGLDDKYVYPWGNDMPKYLIHANLSFFSPKQRLPKPQEVGLYPKGKSRTGIYDLIGNVYEIVIGKGLNHYRLAGGAFTSNISKYQTHSVKNHIISAYTQTVASNNLGIRPICEIKKA